MSSNRGPNMFLRSGVRGVCLGLALVSAATLLGQTRNLGSTGQGTLQKTFDQAQEFQRVGKLSKAAGQYRAFLAEALGELAAGYAGVPDYVRSAPLFDEALSLEPSSTLLLDYARTALTMGDIAHAKTLAAEFIRRYPANRQSLAEAHQVLGRALLKLNQDQPARKELETALALDPTFANGYDLAVACLDMDDEKCAVQLFDDMEKSVGDTAELHMTFGRAYGNSDFAPRAVAEFKKALADNPRQPGAHYCLAAAMLATGGDESTVQAAV